MTVNPGGVSPSPPTHPLRLIATITTLVTTIIGALPLLGLALSDEATAALITVVGAASAFLVALFGERQVSPVNPRRTNSRRRRAPKPSA
jgi:hypothetical protein